MRYANAAAFRAGLEARLNSTARAGGRPVAQTRKSIAFTRLLARLQAVAPDAWLLKGGFALELRLSTVARATRDVDLDWRTGIDDAIEALIAASRVDLGDFFEFAIERSSAAEPGVGGGVRFRAEALVAGRQFERLLIDVGLDQVLVGPVDHLDTPDYLGFAGVLPPRVPAVPLEQHLAEKVHAYTRRYGVNQDSSRPKDLIDILLIAHMASFNSMRLREAVVRVFDQRGTHPLPGTIGPPPFLWSVPYRALAGEVGLDQDPAGGYAEASAFLNPVLGGSLDARWDSASWAWR